MNLEKPLREEAVCYAFGESSNSKSEITHYGGVIELYEDKLILKPRRVPFPQTRVVWYGFSVSNLSTVKNSEIALFFSEISGYKRQAFPAISDAFPPVPAFLGRGGIVLLHSNPTCPHYIMLSTTFKDDEIRAFLSSKGIKKLD